MSFISVEFFIFFPSVIILNALIQKLNNKRISTVFLLISNLAFYSFFNIKFTALLLISALISYICALKANKKLFFITGIVLPLIILGFFKYFNFFLETLHFEPINILLPLGISFYTFEIISYVADVRLKKYEAEKDFLAYITYITFFPNIVSGPIARANDLLKQIKEGRKQNLNCFCEGIQIIVFGIFKKMVLADRLAIFVNDVYTSPEAFSSFTILLALISYSIQIYMDFSGYSDIAIGCAKCLGFDFKKNFNMPYISQSISEFWNRWHISLSSWFKDYVYIPLGGNRKGKTRQYINLIIVMTLSGLWHGASWTFVFWGLLNGILLIIEKAIHRDRFNNFKIYRVIITFIIVTFTWVFFRANSFAQATTVLKCLFSFQNGIRQPYIYSFISILIIGVSMFLIIKKDNRHNAYYPIQNLKTIKGLTVFLIFAGLLICLAYTNTSPFVYAQF